MNKVLSMCTNTEAASFDSLNGKVHFSVLEGNGPEITLDNDCYLLFDSVTQYYSIITNAKFFSIEANAFDLEAIIAAADMHVRDECARVCEYKRNIISEVTQINGLMGFDNSIYILRRE